jgi:hypothetical protein
VKPEVTYSPKQVAQMAHDFLETPFGKYFINHLSVQYNGLHQEAEDPSLSPAQKAYKVERAAGIKVAINFLLERDQLLQADYYKDKPMFKR